MRTRRNYGGLDIFRIFAALLVVAIHTSPLAVISEGGDFLLTRILARVAVPFFLMVTGHFIGAGFLNPSVRSLARFYKFLQKTILLYVFCILLYLPVGIYANHYADMTVGSIFRMIIFDGTFYHLWYFPACILGILLICLLSRFLSLGGMTVVSAVLYLIGLLGDSYYGLVQKVPALETIYEALFHVFSYTRNGLFLAPVFLVLGMWMAVLPKKNSAGTESLPFRLGGLAVSFAVMTGEAFTLRHFELQRHDSMYFALIPVMFFLYQCLLYIRSESAKRLRTAATWIYILHPAVIVAVRGIAKPLHLTELLVDNNLIHYIVVGLLSTASGFFMNFLLSLIGSGRWYRSFRPAQKALSHEAGRYDTEYEEDPNMLETEYETNSENWTEDETLWSSGQDNAAVNGTEEEYPPYDTQNADEPQPKENVSTDGAEDCILKIMSGKSASGRQITAPEIQDAGSETLSEDLPEPNTFFPHPWPEASDQAKPNARSRAWIELDASALQENVEFFRSRIPRRCRLMPAVKADAYGHGIVPIAGLLARMGVDAFSVACISEGITLRNAGITGKILILGYTAPEDFPLLRFYRLTQTVVDYAYAVEMNRFGEKLHVHIGIDTGMHRIGIRCENIEEIASVYQMKNLVVDGLFTHLCVSDSPHPEHRAFTTSQLRAFYQVIDILKADGYPCPGLHILASYGILNLLPDSTRQEQQGLRSLGSRTGPGPDRLAGDFVRPGIALYGVLSTTADQNVWKNALKPVLSLKARITSIRPLYAGESVSYGITYTAPQDMRIAAVAIGYADGLPRELSNGKGSVLINGRRAPIIGRICMDQCIVDISRIPGVKSGDIAVIIGRSGTEEITAAQIAETCGTITHEVLTGLAGRLGRIVMDSARID